MKGPAWFKLVGILIMAHDHQKHFIHVKMEVLSCISCMDTAYVREDKPHIIAL